MGRGRKPVVCEGSRLPSLRHDRDRGGWPRFSVEITEDPHAFLAAAEEHLAAGPVLTTVVSSVTHRALADRRGRCRRAAAPALVGGRAGRGRGRRGRRDADGAVPAAPAVRAADAGGCGPGAGPCAPRARRGGAGLQRCAAGRPGAGRGDRRAHRADGVAVHEHIRLFELGDLVEPAPVPGRLRLAELDDVDLALAWFQAFEADAAEQAGRTERRAGCGLPDPGRHGRSGSTTAGSGSGRTETGSAVHLTGSNPPASASPGSARSTRRASSGAGLRQRCGRRGLPATCSPRARGSACSPTRPTRRRTGSTRRWATGRWSTWRICSCTDRVPRLGAT